MAFIACCFVFLNKNILSWTYVMEYKNWTKKCLEKSFILNWFSGHQIFTLKWNELLYKLSGLVNVLQVLSANLGILLYTSNDIIAEDGRWKVI